MDKKITGSSFYIKSINLAIKKCAGKTDLKEVIAMKQDIDRLLIGITDSYQEAKEVLELLQTPDCPEYYKKANPLELVEEAINVSEITLKLQSELEKRIKELEENNG